VSWVAVNCRGKYPISGSWPPGWLRSAARPAAPNDLRQRGYLKTLEILARPDRRISDSDRAQLRAIQQACDSSEASAHSGARTFRNTLAVTGALLAALLAGVSFVAVTGE
jgi:hypothetical protein